MGTEGFVTDSFVLKCLYETYYDHDNSSSRSRNGLRYHKRELVLMPPKENFKDFLFNAFH